MSVNGRGQQQRQKQSKTEKTRRAKHSLAEASPSDVITFSRGRIYYTLYRRAQMARTVMILLKKKDHVRFICCAVLRIDWASHLASVYYDERSAMVCQAQRGHLRVWNKRRLPRKSLGVCEQLFKRKGDKITFTLQPVIVVCARARGRVCMFMCACVF